MVYIHGQSGHIRPNAVPDESAVMAEIGPAQPQHQAPTEAFAGRDEFAGSGPPGFVAKVAGGVFTALIAPPRCGMWAFVAKVTAGVFATIIAPLLVGLILKSFDSSSAPAPVPQPAGEHAKLETAGDAPPRSAEPELVFLSATAPATGQSARTRADEPNRVLTPAPWKPLFNGRDLAGWTAADARWSVDTSKGVLVGHDTSGTKSSIRCWIYSDQEFADFRLRLEYKIEPHSDAGIMLRLPEGVRPDEGYKIQLTGQDSGALMATGTIIGLRVGKGHPHTRPSIPIPPPSDGDWNQVEIDFRGPRLRMTFNGKLVQDARFDKQPQVEKTNNKVLETSGRIALQSRTGHVEFRKIEIQELKPAPG